MIFSVLVWQTHTRSKAVEQALGWVAQKIGFPDILLYLMVILDENLCSKTLTEIFRQW